jgi:small subunit ribosomal protein S17e
MKRLHCWKKTQNHFLEYRYKKPYFTIYTVDRIKRLSNEVLEEYKSKFGEDFVDNKKILDQISIIRSKGLKNEIAGYITKFIKKEIREEKAQSQIASSQTENPTIKENTVTRNVNIEGQPIVESILESEASEFKESTA